MKNMSADRRMIKIAMAAPYLAREEEHNLAIRWKDHEDRGARNQIAMAHMRLVISMAGKFRNFGLPMSDLVQEGYVGLLEAAARFEPARDVRFSTYASWWIRASIQDYICATGRSCAVARVRLRRRCSSICAVCAPSLPRATRS